MWPWRAFIFSLGIAFFVAMTSPANAQKNFSPDNITNVLCFVETHADLSHTDSLGSFAKSLTQDHSSSQYNDVNPQDKAPDLDVRYLQNISLPPIERQAVSTFSSVIQTEPNFVLIHEFHPEILGLKHFLAPLIANTDVPWYLRSDAPNSHNRVTGWKDGNTLYTGTITYLS